MEHMSTQQAERIPTLTLGWRLKMALADGSAQEMADYLGVSRQTISRWMADKGKAPARAYIAQWALKTGVPTTWLEHGTEPDGPTPGPGVSEDNEALQRLTRSKASRSAGKAHNHQYGVAA